MFQKVYITGVRGMGFRTGLLRVPCILYQKYFKHVLNISGTSVSPTIKWFSAVIKQHSLTSVGCVVVILLLTGPRYSVTALCTLVLE